jgi:glycogen debranching enzyme
MLPVVLLAAALSTYDVRVPAVKTNNPMLDRAFRIAVGDLLGNVAPYRSGLLKEPAPVMLAGLGYPTPWTRDASMNSWNGASLLIPEVARNTLLAVASEFDGERRIVAGDQYWDAIVWVTGAWNHYLYTGDREFLRLAYEVSRNSLRYFERTEFDPADGLFRGPGWSDGIAGYPDEYNHIGGNSGINVWPKYNPDRRVPVGYGIPIKALSTNCLYYNAYSLIGEMARELGLEPDSSYRPKAAALKNAINRAFWLEDRGYYRFLVGDDHQEALGQAYALLFGIADGDRARNVLEHQYVAPAGVPCLWPNFDRYRGGYARHAGTVWPQIQGMWAQAAAVFHDPQRFGHELFALAAHAVRDNQFTEIYHPLTGEPYGGLQERAGKGIVLWAPQPRQTWAATAFVRMIVFGLAGLRVSAEGIRFEPCLPTGVDRVEIDNLHIREGMLNISITRGGTRTVANPVIPWARLGTNKLEVVLAQ